MNFGGDAFPEIHLKDYQQKGKSMKIKESISGFPPEIRFILFLPMLTEHFHSRSLMLNGFECHLK